MFNLFNIISIFYVFRSVQLLVQILREWADVVQEPLTQRKKYLAEQASFFIAVPIGVFVHELGHALAVLFFGGEVLSFQFRFFWGAVEHIGTYTPVERWLISFAGTLGSLLFGIGIWLLLRHNKVSSLRYFGLRAFRFQIYFSLLYYPLFSVVFPIGDWKIIYDFAMTPIVSSVTLVIHLLFLLLYWQYDRKGSFEAPAMESVSQQAKFEELERLVTLNPHDTQAQLEYVDMLRRGGANNRAKTYLKDMLKENPNSAGAYLELAAIEAGKRNQASKRAHEYAGKALQLGLSDPYQIAVAKRIGAQFNLEKGNGDAALQAYSEAITAIKGTGQSTQQMNMLAVLYRERSLAYRRLQKYDLAYADLAEAISLTQKSGQSELAATYEKDLAVLENHAGRKPGLPANDSFYDV